jgi:hypothetical protein
MRKFSASETWLSGIPEAEPPAAHVVEWLTTIPTDIDSEILKARFASPRWIVSV